MKMVGKPVDTYDVFLSHAHLDAEAVESLGSRLVDEGHVRVWLDRWVLVPGQHWQQEMAKGLDHATACAVCIGSHTPEGWFREEIERALNRQTKDREFRVIPVILPDGDPRLVDSFLELRTWVDFRKGLKDRYALHLLLSGIRGVQPGRYPSERHDREMQSRFEKLDELLNLSPVLYSDAVVSNVRTLAEPTAQITLLEEIDGSQIVRAVEKQHVSIGRKPDCTVVIPDDTVSWEHGEIFFHGGSYRYRHLSKSNTTVLRHRSSEYVFRAKHGSQRILHSQDRLIIGRHVFIVDCTLVRIDQNYRTTKRDT
jgi:TIR domain-containing protein/FHA domain-containing protein